MALLIHVFLRVTFDTAELTGCAWSAADALRLRHVPSPCRPWQAAQASLHGVGCAFRRLRIRSGGGTEHQYRKHDRKELPARAPKERAARILAPHDLLHAANSMFPFTIRGTIQRQAIRSWIGCDADAIGFRSSTGTGETRPGRSVHAAGSAFLMSSFLMSSMLPSCCFRRYDSLGDAPASRRLARAMAQAGENSTEAPSDGSPKLLMISV
jgi:hypothetical protein